MIENAGQGTDTIKALASYRLGGNVKNLTLPTAAPGERQRSRQQ